MTKNKYIIAFTLILLLIAILITVLGNSHDAKLIKSSQAYQACLINKYSTTTFSEHVGEACE